MAYAAAGYVVRQIESLFDGGSAAGLTDRQLLERFTARRDAAAEAAFAALVTRHGPTVLELCRQILGDLHHAEDAFQAVFLVLARKAVSIREPDLLANWLYGVAHRTARCKKLQLARQRKNEMQGAMRRRASGSGTAIETLVQPVERPAMDTDDVEALHDEIARLPGSFRLPIVLCYFEGLTLDEAASRLAWPAGTLRSRLARARAKLRRGLTRRGISMPVAVLATALDARSALACMSPSLCDATTKAAIQCAAGQAVRQVASASVAALTEEVIRTMLINNIRFVLLTLLALGAFATGAGYMTNSLAMKDELKRAPAVSQKSAAKAVARDRAATAPGRMMVAGRVLDVAGKPMAGVPVDVIGRSRKPLTVNEEKADRFLLLGRGTSDAKGRLLIDASRSSSIGFFEVYALAAVPGFGLSWAQLNADAARPAAEIQLQTERIVRGKLTDITGLPAARVELCIVGVRRPSNIGLLDGMNLAASQVPEGLRNWPRPVITDDNGRFTLAGIGPDLAFSLSVRDSRFAQQTIHIGDANADISKELVLAVQPATIVEGRALTADTGQPIAKTIVEVTSRQQELSGETSKARVMCDAQGRFTANVAPGKYFEIRAFPPEGLPYFVITQEFEWTKGAVKKATEVKLSRGVVVRGKVTEFGTSRPLGGASVQFIPARPRRNALSGWLTPVASNDDGSYQIVVPPGKGHLFVYGPTPDYLLQAIGGRMIYLGQPGGERYYAHDIIAYEVKEGDAPREIAASLRPGKTVRGRIVGPGGQTIDRAEIVATLQFNYFHLNWRGDLTIHARDGAFELHGLDPEKTTRVHILDPDHEWGATAELSGKQAGEEPTIRLQPCGQAKARFVGPDGKPIPKIYSRIEILGTPGPHRFDRRPEAESMLNADAAALVNLDRKHYWNNNRFTDTEGQIIFPDLIPGASYRINDFSTGSVPGKGVQVRKDFTVKPGEMLDLGDILIEKPQR